MKSEGNGGGRGEEDRRPKRSGGGSGGVDLVVMLMLEVTQAGRKVKFMMEVTGGQKVSVNFIKIPTEVQSASSGWSSDSFRFCRCLQAVRPKLRRPCQII